MFIVFDVEKTFDLVWHHGLLHKLKSIGTSVQMFKIIDSRKEGSLESELAPISLILCLVVCHKVHVFPTFISRVHERHPNQSEIQYCSLCRQYINLLTKKKPQPCNCKYPKTNERRILVVQDVASLINRTQNH